MHLVSLCLSFQLTCAVIYKMPYHPSSLSMSVEEDTTQFPHAQCNSTFRYQVSPTTKSTLGYCSALGTLHCMWGWQCMFGAEQFSKWKERKLEKHTACGARNLISLCRRQNANYSAIVQCARVIVETLL